MAIATPEVLERLADDPDRFPGALLLTGSSEAELEAESRRLATGLLCPGDDPEKRCGSCRRVASGVHPDFLSVEPDKFQIKVERIREALAFGAGRPYESARRVARISRADLLGVEGANSLLKSLEEPGERFRWILTTIRPESLLTTIRSRCTLASLPPPAFSDRLRSWRDRGFAEEDSRDLVAFGVEEEEASPADRLEEARGLRQTAVAALEDGIASGRLPSLVMLAEVLAAGNRGDARLLSELLADAAIAAHAPSSDALRHRAVAGRLGQLVRWVGAEALRDASVAAADPPADVRKGNKRLHYEKLLLELYASRRPSAASR